MNRTNLRVFRTPIIALGLAAFVCFTASPSWALAPPPPILWSKTFSDTGPPFLTPAPGGGLYLGTSGNNNDGAIVRLDSNGNELWRQTLAASRSADDVATDLTGNLLVSSHQTGNPSNTLLQKYSPTGTLQWTQQVATPRADMPTGLDIDAAGNAYLANAPWTLNYGNAPAGTFNSLQSYAPNGTLNWSRTFDTGDGTSPGGFGPQAGGVAVDYSGHVFSAFNNYTNTANVIDSYAYLSKSSLDGQLLWVKKQNTTFGDITGIAVDAHDNVYISAVNAFRKYDSEGNLLWSVINNNLTLMTVAIGPGNEIFAAGASGFDTYIAQYNSNGTVLWSDIHPSGADEVSRYLSLTISGDKLVVSGWIATQQTLSGNRVVAYQFVPEPTMTGLMLVAAACSALGARRGRA